MNGRSKKILLASLSLLGLVSFGAHVMAQAPTALAPQGTKGGGFISLDFLYPTDLWLKASNTTLDAIFGVGQTDKVVALAGAEMKGVAPIATTPQSVVTKVYAETYVKNEIAKLPIPPVCAQPPCGPTPPTPPGPVPTADQCEPGKGVYTADGSICVAQLFGYSNKLACLKGCSSAWGAWGDTVRSSSVINGREVGDGVAVGGSGDSRELRACQNRCWADNNPQKVCNNMVIQPVNMPIKQEYAVIGGLPRYPLRTEYNGSSGSWTEAPDCLGGGADTDPIYYGDSKCMKPRYVGTQQQEWKEYVRDFRNPDAHSGTQTFSDGRSFIRCTDEMNGDPEGELDSIADSSYRRYRSGEMRNTERDRFDTILRPQWETKWKNLTANVANTVNASGLWTMRSGVCTRATGTPWVLKQCTRIPTLCGGGDCVVK